MAEAMPPNNCRTISDRPSEKTALKSRSDHEKSCASCDTTLQIADL